MWKKCIVLKDKTDVAVPRGDVDVLRRTEPDVRADAHLAAIRAQQSGDRMQRDRLAGAGWTKQHVDVGVAGKAKRQPEFALTRAQTFFDVDLKLHCVPRGVGDAATAPRRRG